MAPFRVRADDKRNGAMRIHVIGTVLRVVLDDEDRCFSPELRMGQRFDEHPERQIVVRHGGDGRPLVGSRARSMIVGQPHDLQPRHVALLFKALQLRDKPLDALHIEIVRVKAAIPGIEMPFEGLHLGSARVGNFLSVGDELAVAAIAHARLARAVPQITARGNGQRKISFRRV